VIAHRVGGLRPAAALLALLASLLIQVGTNFANDYSDFRHGADADRVGPTRVTQSGLVPPGTVKLAAWIAFGISGLFGIALAAMSGWPILVIGLASVAVKLGARATRVQYAVLALAPFVLAIVLGTLWPLLALPALLPALRTVLTQEGAALNRGLGETARAQILYSLLLAAGLWQ